MAANLLRGVPVLPAGDVDVALAFYTDKLGFAEAFRDATPARYAGIKRDSVEIHLAAMPEGMAKTIADQTMCRIAVADVAALYEEYKAKDLIHPNGPLHETPWGTSEFAVIDADGVCLTFFGA